MAIFKKLTVGDTVATSGARVFKKLTTEEPTPSKPVWNGTDLTGTEWHIPQGWTAEAGYGVFDVSGGLTYLVGDSNNTTHTMTSLYIGFELPMFGDPYASSNTITCRLVGGGSPTILGEDNIFALNLTFTGGTDLTNTSLINWLLENGELISHQFSL